MNISYDEFFASEIERRYQDEVFRPPVFEYSYILPDIIKYVKDNDPINILVIGAGGVGTNIVLTLYEISMYCKSIYGGKKLYNFIFVDPDKYEYHNIFRIRNLTLLVKNRVAEELSNLKTLYKAEVLSRITKVFNDNETSLINNYYLKELTKDLVNTILEDHSVDVVIECASRKAENLAIKEFDIEEKIPVISIGSDGNKHISVRRTRKINEAPIADGYVKIDAFNFIWRTVAAGYTLPILFNLLNKDKKLLIDLTEKELMKVFSMEYSDYTEFIENCVYNNNNQ